MATIVRIILYSVIAVLLGANLYLFTRKGDAPAPNGMPAAQSDSSQSPVSSDGPSSAQVPPPVQVPAIREIINETEENSALFQNAKESFEKGDYKTAAGLCKELAKKDKRAFLCVGLAYFKLADYENSINFLEQSLDGGGDEFISRRFLAFAYYYRDNFEKSLFNAGKAISISRDPELDNFYQKLLREKSAKANFTDEGTLHFKVQFDGYVHGGISRKVLGILEDAYSSIGRDLNYFPSEPITVILYSTQDFYDVTQVPVWVGGFFDKNDGRIRVPVKGVEGQERLLRTVLFHEYVHALIQSITRSCPLWLHEGMAEYYAKGPSQRIGQIIPLNRLETSLAGLTGKGIAVAYAESHSAVSYLMDQYRPYRMKDLLFSLSKGNDLNAAFTEAFQMSYTEFIQTWGKK